MRAKKQPMLRVVAQATPQADGGLMWSVGVCGLTRVSAPVAVAAVLAAVSAGCGCRCARSCSGCAASFDRPRTWGKS